MVGFQVTQPESGTQPDREKGGRQGGSRRAEKAERWQRAFSTQGIRGTWAEVPGTLSGYEVV